MEGSEKKHSAICLDLLILESVGKIFSISIFISMPRYLDLCLGSRFFFSQFTKIQISSQHCMRSCQWWSNQGIESAIISQLSRYLNTWILSWCAQADISVKTCGVTTVRKREIRSDTELPLHRSGGKPSVLDGSESGYKCHLNLLRTSCPPSCWRLAPFSSILFTSCCNGGTNEICTLQEGNSTGS